MFQRKNDTQTKSGKRWSKNFPQLLNGNFYVDLVRIKHTNINYTANEGNEAKS